jgi:hypothetical protein
MQAKAIIESVIRDQRGPQIIRLLSGIEEMYRPVNHSLEERVAWHENTVSVLNQVRDLLKASGDYVSAVAFSDDIMEEPMDLTRTLEYLDDAENSLKTMERNHYSAKSDFENVHHHIQCLALSVAILYSGRNDSAAMRKLVFDAGLWPRWDGRDE